MSEKERILIVDDEVTDAISLQMDLLHLGYQGCGIESSGEPAIAAIQTTPPDLILMDLTIETSESVFQTAEEILKVKQFPLLFLVEGNDEGIMKKISSFTTSTYLNKPVTSEDVVSKIKEIL